MRTKSCTCKLADPAQQLSIAEAASFLSVSEKDLRRRVRRREIPHVRMGRLIRIRRADLLRYQDTNTVPALAEGGAL